MPREVDLQRRDRRRAALERVKVGALAGFLAFARRPYPVDRSTMGIPGLNNRLRLVPETEAANPYAVQFLVGNVRDVYIEDELLGQSISSRCTSSTAMRAAVSKCVSR